MAVQASPTFLGHAVWQCESLAVPTRAEQNRHGGTGTARSQHSAALHCATALSCLPTVNVSLLCPHHVLFTKAHTHILKQKNNSIMRLAACALSFWFTIVAPHWKDPYTGGGKTTLKSLASTRIIKVSFPLNKLLWDLMQLIWAGNTNKQTNKVFFHLPG